MKIYDVSQPLSGAIAVWPGDQPFELRWTMRQDQGDRVNVAALQLSVHTGTHVDAPYHVSPRGKRTADLALEPFIGPARVLHAVGQPVLDDVLLERARGAQRVLFRTRQRVDSSEFPASFATPTPDFARQLVMSGVVLIGSDAPSMDPPDSKTLDAHKVFAAAGVAMLENLVLDEVPEGDYTLIALPLKLMEADGSPVRAVLVEGALPQ